MKIYYYIYQITNLVNNKIYVGVHKTSDLNDGYMGSGKVIKDAILKYGINNFKKDILEFFEDSGAMYAREKEIVTDEFLLREDTYNLRRGGNGGFDYINSDKFDNPTHTTEHAIMMTIRRFEIYSKEHRRNWSVKGGMASKNSGVGIHDPNIRCDWSGRNHNKDTIEKMKTSHIGKHDGRKNSQYGTCWIYHELIGNKKIKKELLPEFIEQGWVKGRTV
jgi:hypothetical protein